MGSSSLQDKISGGRFDRCLFFASDGQRHHCGQHRIATKKRKEKR
jgi:hypothetical protein